MGRPQMKLNRDTCPGGNESSLEELKTFLDEARQILEDSNRLKEGDLQLLIRRGKNLFGGTPEKQNYDSAILEGSPIAQAVFEGDKFQLTRANIACREFFDAHFTNDHTVYSLLKLSQSEFELLFGQVGQKDIIKILEFEMTPGTIVEMEVHARRICLGECSGLLLAFRNVTEEIQLARSFSELDTRFRGVVDSEMIGIFFWELDGKITEANAYFLKLLGYSREELAAGKLYWNKLTPPEYAELDKSVHQLILKKGACAPFEKEFFHKMGDRVPVLIGAAKLKDEEGKGVAFILNYAEKRQLDLQLQESEERFRTVLENLGEGLLITDLSDMIIYANPQLEKLTGYSPSEILGKYSHELLTSHGREAGALNRPPKSLFTSHEQYEELFRTREGGTFWGLVNAAPLQSSTNEVAGTIKAISDITPKKEAEIALRRFDRTLSLLKECGKAVARATSEPELLRQVCTLIVHSGGYKMAWVGFACMDESKSIQCVAIAGDDEGYLENAKLTWADTPRGNGPAGKAIRTRKICIIHDVANDPSFAPWKTEALARDFKTVISLPLGGGPGGIFGVITLYTREREMVNEEETNLLHELSADLSFGIENLRARASHKLAEQSLRDSESRFHSIWENSVDGMRLTDVQGIIVAVNKAYCLLVGLDRNELQGKPFTATYEEIDPEEMLQKYRQSFADQKIERVMERKVTFRKGKKVHLSVTHSFIEASNRPTLLLALFRDITNQRLLEEQLRQAQKMESIGQLAGGIAHDFNNILTVIQGHASLLSSESIQNPEIAEAANEISEASRRAANLTRQLLTFSRRQIIQPKPLMINDVVRSIGKLLSRLLGEQITLQFQLGDCLPPIAADPGMMEQVLLNLAVNARDAMPNGGRLMIKSSRVQIGEQFVEKHPAALTGDFIRLSVSDNGCGIDQENIAKIFDPFFTTKEVGKGTGLGLATVYGIVQQHKGFILLSTKIGEGTEFDLYFPASAMPTESAVAVSRPVVEIRKGLETIMVVEDEESLRSLVCHVLSRQNYSVIPAASGVEALRIWEARGLDIDLVLTDLVMPDGVSGFQLAEKLALKKPNIKVIYTSGYSPEIGNNESILVEGVNFLPKPYPPDLLIRTVRAILDRS
ncbi:MAG: Histidine kinase [Verrucomicrobiales bacterium]|nr:Histidine kinase [Verrucomicrobiales bacterium]